MQKLNDAQSATFQSGRVMKSFGQQFCGGSNVLIRIIVCSPKMEAPV
jgi:hypothetical protein